MGVSSACGRRFRVFNIVDDVTRECLAAIPDTSISGCRVARELTDIIAWRVSPRTPVVDGQSTRRQVVSIIEHQ